MFFSINNKTPESMRLSGVLQDECFFSRSIFYCLFRIIALKIKKEIIITAIPARNPKIVSVFIFRAKIRLDKTAIRISDMPMAVITDFCEPDFMNLFCFSELLTSYRSTFASSCFSTFFQFLFSLFFLFFFWSFERFFFYCFLSVLRFCHDFYVLIVSICV